MALPTLQRKLFQNDGYGPLLKDEIVSKHISVQDWSNAYDYPVATVVRGSDGILYYSVQTSGPGTGAGYRDPTADAAHAYWVPPQVPSMPVSDSSNSAVSSYWVNSWYSNLVIPDELYVDAVNGDDANDGYSAATAKKSLAAIESILTSPILLKPQAITIYLANGNYAERLIGFTGLDLTYYGASSNVIISGNNSVSVQTAEGSALHLKGTFTLSGRLEATSNGTVDLIDGLNITFSSGRYQACIRANGGRVRKKDLQNIAIHFNNVTVTTGCFVAEQGGFIAFSTGSETMTGTVTGKRYMCQRCGGISGLGSTTAIPGTVAGTVDDTSYYIS